MPFLAEDHFPIPNQDILSWYFDKPNYDMDEPIYIDAINESRSWSGRQAKQAIRQLAAGFRANGLSAGDCVCIHSFNDVDYPILVNGIVGFGGIYAGTNPAYTAYELVHHLKTSQAKIVIAETEILDNLLKAAKEIGLSQDMIFIFNHNDDKVPEGFKSWKSLLDHGEMDWPKFDDEKTASSTIAARLYSSGTTGLPKAGMLSHRNLVAEHTLTEDWKPRGWKTRRLIALPMFHAATAPVCHFSGLRTGWKAYVLKKFDLELFLKYIEKYAITDLGVVPMQAIVIINSPITKKYSLKSIRHATCGAAPLDKGPQARLKALLSPGAPFTQVWGMTETSCVCSMNPHVDGHETTGSVGRMLPGIDAKLVDEDGRDVSDYDVRGELCVRGPLIIKGYYNNPEANARDWDKDGYFHTGDVAYRSSTNKLWYIVDRKKELIKVRGFQVAPPELEAVLLSHPEIVDAAVIGVKKSRDDSELPRAYIVRRPGSGEKLTVEDIKKYMAERLVYYKRLDGGVVFRDAIPKNPSGKILKRILREEAAEEMKKPGAKL